MDEKVDRSAPPPEVEAPRSRRRPAVRRIVRYLLGFAVLVAVAVVGWRYWQHGQHYVSTNDAYVNANVVQIGAQVAGPITQLAVQNQQHVNQGELLFVIDPRPYEAAVAAAEAELELARQQVAEQTAAVAAERAQLAQRRAELQNATANNTRIQNLVEQGSVSAQAAQQAKTEQETAAAAVTAAKANLEQARNALGESGEQNASIQAAQAKLRQAKLDLGHTRVTAPATGRIANLSLRPGTTVQEGMPLFAIVSDRNYWVDANFKETEIGRIEPGQKATITIDTDPGRAFVGRVESLSAGSGTAFSLLPPQNATGNWVKVTQRVPVRVQIVDANPHVPLHIGTSATVEIRTG